MKTRKIKRKGGTFRNRLAPVESGIELEDVNDILQRKIRKKETEERIEYEKRDNFIRLGNTHIMSPLSWVHATVWLQKEKCNIFLIGEVHKIRNRKCKSIFNMFSDLIRDIESTPVPSIDILLETTETDINMYKRFKEEKPIETTLKNWAYDLSTDPRQDTFKQINMVRILLSGCIDKYTSNCPFRVHWTDPNSMMRLPTRQHRLPDNIAKLFGLQPEDLEIKYNGYKEDYNIDKNTIYKYFINILNQHGVIQKELKKAEQLNEHFNTTFVETILKQIIDRCITHEIGFFLILRSMIDFYTAARIISHKMENVIVYEGMMHIDNLIFILRSLGYAEMSVLNPQCTSFK